VWDRLYRTPTSTTSSCQGITTASTTLHSAQYAESVSFAPPQQVDYCVDNGWVPCLEFSPAEIAYIDSPSTTRFGAVSANYYDNRYWTLWKLPMFGCTDADQVLKEINNCTKAFPDAYVRMVAFDSSRQVQVMGFLVQVRSPHLATLHWRCPLQSPLINAACDHLPLSAHRVQPMWWNTHAVHAADSSMVHGAITWHPGSMGNAL
jgi:ribulose bisphosphate carboxylase small subunit